MAKYG